MNLPTRHDSEIATIGCCILGGLDTCIEAVETIPIDALTLPHVRDVYKIIEHLSTIGQPINEYTIDKEWRKEHNDHLPDEILRSVDKIPSAANLSIYVSEIVESWRKRRLIEACSMVLSRAQNDRENVDKIVADADAILQSEEIKSVETVNAKEASQRMIDDLERRFNLQGKLSGVPSGFHKLDYKTDGFQYGEQTVIGARPSAGKTAIALCFAAHAAFELNIPTLFVSLEMSVSSLMRRFLSLRSELSMSEIRRGTYSEQDFRKITAFRIFVDKSPLKIVNAVGGIGINALCAAIRRRCRKDGTKLVIIDYLQKIKPSEKQEKRTYEVAEVSTALKSVAVTTGCALVTLAQLNRDSEKDKSPRPPRLSDLADSGQIERDADTVALIHRDRNDASGHTDLIIAKQRDGETGVVPLVFNGTLCRFQNPLI